MFCHPYLNNCFPVQERSVAFEILEGEERMSGPQRDGIQRVVRGSLLRKFQDHMQEWVLEAACGLGLDEDKHIGD